MSETKWTKDQKLAIDTRDCNLLVAAAAGSGKTAVLVERIIKIITDEENDVDIDKLLVVTFTNAAASEMRERIGDAITRELDKNPGSIKLQRQLTLLLKSSITTIHSFCLEVIKNNFHVIDIDPVFRIGDETETTILKQEVIGELFEEKYDDEEGREQFLRLVECYGGSRDDLPLQDIILQLYNYAKSSPYTEKWLNETAESYNITDEFKFGASKWAEVIIENVRLEAEGLISNLQKAKACAEASEGLELYIPNIELEIKALNDIAEKAEGKDWQGLSDIFNSYEFEKMPRAAKNADNRAKEYVKGLRDEAKKKFKILRDEIFSYDEESIKEEIKYLYPLIRCLCDLVIEFDKRYSEKKKEKGIIDFNDIEHLCLKILTSEDDKGNIIPSEVALQYRNKFYEVLVDEYQDSNLVQEVLLSMVSKKNQENPNMFMVGDVKQSIYRFRQAKPELFLEKYNTYSLDENSKNRKIMLFKNFRSREEVIEGVNYIFKCIMSKKVGELEYNNNEKLNLGASYPDIDDASSKVGGPVEIHLIEKTGARFKPDNKEENQNNEAEEDEEVLLKEDEEIIDNMQLEARMIGKRIKELMSEEDGKRLKIYDKNSNQYRNVEYRDIVILLRATSNWAPVFMEELTHMGIPTFADTGTGYFETIEIKTVLSLLQIIDNPMQDIPLLAVLRSPIASFEPEELINIRMEDINSTYYEAMKKISEKDGALSNKVKVFLNNIRSYQEKSLDMPIDEFLWFLYLETGYFGYVGAMPGGYQRQANLRVLFERARQYEDTSFKGLFNFVNFINKLRISSGDMGSAKIVGENEDVVRIMSIHKSKGLEFPIVFVSGMGKNFNKMDLSKSILFHHELGLGADYVDYERRIAYTSIIKEALKKKINLESLSEEMRILYVALTRAKEKLIITGTVKDAGKSIEKWASEVESVDNPDEFKVPAYEILKGRCFFDWIGPAVIVHKDAKLLSDIAVSNIPEYMVSEDKSSWKFRIWKNEDIIDNNITSDEENKNILEELQAADLNTDESSYSEEIKRKLEYKYKYINATKLPAKLSVTEIKKIIGSEEDDVIVNLYEVIENDNGIEVNYKENIDVNNIKDKPSAVRKPAFIEERDELTATERGTLMHLVMQKLVFKEDMNYKEIKEQINEMIKNEFLTEKQADSIYIKAVEGYFKSPLGIRALKAENIKKEIPFNIEISAKNIYKALADTLEDEKIMVQGIIDYCFEENGEWVLIDYKTDYALEEDIEKIKDRYRVQLECYQYALEKVTGKKVKEKYIYLLSLGKEILI